MEDDSLGAFWVYETVDGHKRRILAAGVWVSPHLILLSRSHIGTESVVRHEMLHDLLPTLAHESSLFVTCTGLPAGLTTSVHY